MVSAVVKAMSQYLSERGYIKMNPYLYMKNIRTDVVTGDILLVDLLEETVRVMTVVDKFLFFHKRPTVILDKKHYTSISQFKSFIKANEIAEVEYIKKAIDWSRKTDGRI